MTRKSRRPDKPKLKRTGAPIELTDYAPFNSNIRPRRHKRELLNWSCPNCTHDNPRWRVQCQRCMVRRP